MGIFALFSYVIRKIAAPAPTSTWLVSFTPCRPPPQVSWIRGRDLRILTVGGYTYTTDLRFEAFHQPHSTEWTLRIKSVQLRDQGGYECQIATKPIRTYIIFLRVEGQLWWQEENIFKGRWVHRQA